MAVRLLPFSDEHLAAAGELLARRHARHRTAEPLLPALADPAAEVERAWALEGVSGAVAVDGGEVVGYLFARLAESDLWGRHVWVDPAGHAAEPPEVVRDLYALAAGLWVEGGALLHIALVPALADLVDPWLRLGFGHMQVHAIRPSGGPHRALPRAVAVRPGRPADLDATAPLRRAIWEHQALPPTLTGLEPPPDDQLRADWEETLAEAECTYFVAERAGRIVGHALLHPAEPGLGTPADAVCLAVAATLTEARGLGIGVALTEHVLAWARDEGYETVVTDWRMTNLPSSRFWPARGFRETFFRLSRAVRAG